MIEARYILLSILNLIFTGSGLFWRKQSLQAICYMVTFAVLNIFRHDIGAMWAIYDFIAAQIHFHKIRNTEKAKGFGQTGKAMIWFVTLLTLLLYSMMYGPSWTHGGEIKHPILLYFIVLKIYLTSNMKLIKSNSYVI